MKNKFKRATLVIAMSLTIIIMPSNIAFASGTTIAGNVVINGKDASFSNVKVERDFTVEEQGSVILTDVEFKGTSKLEVKGSATIVGGTGELDANNITVTGELNSNKADNESIKKIEEDLKAKKENLNDEIENAVRVLEKIDLFKTEEKIEIALGAKELIIELEKAIDKVTDTTQKSMLEKRFKAAKAPIETYVLKIDTVIEEVNGSTDPGEIQTILEENASDLGFDLGNEYKQLDEESKYQIAKAIFENKPEEKFTIQSLIDFITISIRLIRK